jgi:hypothetical protein
MVQHLVQALAGVQESASQHQQDHDKYRDAYANDNGEGEQDATERVVHIPLPSK